MPVLRPSYSWTSNLRRGIVVTVKAVTCNNPARYLGTSGIPPRIQELNTAVGQCSGSVVVV
jgi:hypothetical protein